MDNIKIKLLDGAMGTMLQKSGLPLGERPELLSLTAADTITGIHKAYVEAGAKIIYANTFGANELKLADTGRTVEEVIPASIAAAKAAVAGTNCQVALDIGPLGELLEPSGTLTFERAYACFARMVKIGESSGADLIVFETMTDLYEVKAAVLAAKENTSLPVMVSMTFEADGRTFTGCSVEAMALLLEGLGVQAAGINCSLGPDEIFPLAKRLCQATSLPVFIKPNAGLPDPATGTYQIDAEAFAQSLVKYCDIGVQMLGGCCGTTPAYIAAVGRAVADKTVVVLPHEKTSTVSSATRVVTIDDVAVIGERINPTGKKLMREALQSGDMGYILRQAVSQVEAGAQILDVNVGAPGVDEASVLPLVVKQIQSVVDVPLQLDSTSPKALEAALRVYNGVPIVNSVNGKDKVMDAVLPLVKKYGACVVGLTLDGTGIPQTAPERIAVAEKIIARCRDFGIAKQRVFIDCLTLTASAQQEGAMETLKALRTLRDMGMKTLLGVSNISFGLPNRPLLNHSFLLLALESGLNLPIMNPNAAGMMDAIRAYRVLSNRDTQSAAYIEAYKDMPAPALSAAPQSTAPAAGTGTEGGLHPLVKAVKDGLADDVKQQTIALLQTTDPMEIVNAYLIPALDLVGDRFEKGTLFLPQLLQAANAAQSAFEEVKKVLQQSGAGKMTKGPIVLATVHGDIHDIGKNIVKVILENYGYQVIDLGRDVPAQRVVDAAIASHAPLVGLSALMTTTLKSMKDTIAALHQAGCPCKIMVGGAVLTPDCAKEIHADFYAKDAKQAADIAKEVIA